MGFLYPKALKRFVKVVAKRIGSDDEKHLELLVAARIDPRVAQVDATSFQLGLHRGNSGYQNRGAILRGVAAGNRESDTHSVALQNDGRYRILPPFHFSHAEVRRVPAGRRIDVRYW